MEHEVATINDAAEIYANGDARRGLPAGWAIALLHLIVVNNDSRCFI